MKINANAMKLEFIEMLKSTNRDGVDNVIADLESEGFFEAPASAGHHLNEPGGLVIHSLNVCKCALMLREQMEKMIPGTNDECPVDSIIIASLLHDVCKANVYRPTMKKVKNEYGAWVEKPGYDCTYKNLPVGHGEKSIIMLLCAGLAMTDAEICAIRWHMGPWNLSLGDRETMGNYNAAKTQFPLCTIISVADQLAAGMVEASPDDVAKL